MIPALLGDQVSAGINSYGVFKQYVEDGSVVPLMTFGEQRSEYFPDVPTAIELGYESAVASRAYFFALPEGTDPEICQTLSDAVANIQNNEEYVQAIADAYCVTAQYYSYDDAMGKLDELWNQMEPYTAIMNQ